MAKRHSSKHRHKRRPRTSTAHGQPKEPAGSELISERATAAIEAQRRRLQIAESVLGCLISALEDSPDTSPRQRPYYPDVAKMVCRMLTRTIDQLDRINLKRAIAAAEHR
ncbi:MAG TPA: hypothetical protein VHK27_02545 [Gammaproteobacteria bacterium]|nr:hypothetical protein [Gammaproteobacteria bacterium]